MAIHTTATNASLAAYRDVGDPAALARAGLFVAEGRLVVERLLADRRYRVHSVLVTPTASSALAAVLESRADVPVLTCDATQMRAITGFQFHRGCLTLAWRDDVNEPLDRIAASRRILALEGITDPDNVGGLFRTALALGADALLLDAATADPFYRKAIRTSMGATLRVRHRRAADWISELEFLRARGFEIVALTPGPQAVTLDEWRMDRDRPCVLLVGAEGPGLSRESLAKADIAVRIPVDPRADSLNVVVAAGIALNNIQHPRSNIE